MGTAAIIGAGLGAAGSMSAARAAKKMARVANKALKWEMQQYGRLDPFRQRYLDWLASMTGVGQQEGITPTPLPSWMNYTPRVLEADRENWARMGQLAGRGLLGTTAASTLGNAYQIGSQRYRNEAGARMAYENNLRNLQLLWGMVQPPSMQGIASQAMQGAQMYGNMAGQALSGIGTLLGQWLAYKSQPQMATPATPAATTSTYPWYSSYITGPYETSLGIGASPITSGRGGVSLGAGYSR